MLEKSDASKLKILFLLNNYSYFSHSKITGPKSMIALIGLLKERGVSIDICIPNCKISNFPHDARVHKVSPLKLLTLCNDCEVIVVDRQFIILGWILSKVFRKKLCLRLLGMGIRLTSNRLISKRNFISILTRISPIDLLISTLDGSGTEQQLKFIRTRKVSHRINGIEIEKTTYIRRSVNKASFFFVGRDSPEKGLLRALQEFLEIEARNKQLDIFGPSQLPDQFCHLLEDGVVRVHGFCDRATIAKRTSNHSIMISCNRLGVLGNAELEALAAGKYIIYLGPKMFLSYLPKQLLRKYGRNYSEVLKKLNNDVAEPLKIDDFTSVHIKDRDSILKLAGSLN